MKLRYYIILVVAFIVGFNMSRGAFAQNQNSPNTLKLNDEKVRAQATIADVSWISGHWQGEGLGGVCEEIWSPPLGNNMMGMFRFVKDGKLVFYEFETIVEESNSLNLKIKHFSQDFIGWEEKGVSVNFPLISLTAKEAVFDGLRFRKIDDDSLNIFVVIQGKEEAFRFKRMSNKAPAFPVSTKD